MVGVRARTTSVARASDPDDVGKIRNCFNYFIFIEQRDTTTRAFSYELWKGDEEEREED